MMLQKLTLNICSMPGTAVKTVDVFTPLICKIAQWGLSPFCSWRNWGKAMWGNQLFRVPHVEGKIPPNECSPGWLHVADIFCLMPIRDASKKAILGFCSHVGEGKERAGTALENRLGKLLASWLNSSHLPTPPTMWKQMLDGCDEHFRWDPAIT